MNNKLLLIAISGDGIEKEGLPTAMLDLGKDDVTLIKLINEEDINKLNILIASDENNRYQHSIIYHIDAFKEYLRNTRNFIYSDNMLKIFNCNNEIELFTLFTKSGNALIQVTDFSTLIYLPKYISDDVKNSILEIEKYIDVNKPVMKQQITKDDKIEQDVFKNYNEFIKEQFNITK